MHKALYLALPLLAAGVIGVPAVAGAAGGSAHSRATAAPKPTSTPRPPAAKPTPKPLTPKPVNVYLGSQLVAVGQSVSGGIARVRGQVPFAIKAPSYAPAGYVPVQLAVTPALRGVSNGFSTLTYAPTTRDKTIMTTSGFQINQSAMTLPFMRSTSAVTVTVAGSAGTVNEFKAGKTDLLILTWSDGAGAGYTITTDAAASRLSRDTLTRIGASLR